MVRNKVKLGHMAICSHTMGLAGPILKTQLKLDSLYQLTFY